MSWVIALIRALNLSSRCRWWSAPYKTIWSVNASLIRKSWESCSNKRHNHNPWRTLKYKIRWCNLSKKLLIWQSRSILRCMITRTKSNSWIKLTSPHTTNSNTLKNQCSRPPEPLLARLMASRSNSKASTLIWMNLNRCENHTNLSKWNK